MAHHAPSGPFSIPAINNVIPEKAKPWIYILFVIIFQFSGGVYLATMNEMVGETALMHEDILMAGYASLAGMTLVYTFMLRLKMRFMSKFSLIFTSFGLILANMITLNTTLIGVITASLFTLYFFAKGKRSYKTTFYIGFTAIIGYLILMYFVIDYGTSLEMLYFPILLRNFGYVVIAIVLLTGLTRIPFNHFFSGIKRSVFRGSSCRKYNWKRRRRSFI